MSTNPRHPLLWGALASGIVMNVLDGATNGVFLLREFQANAARLGLDPGAAESVPAMATWVSMDFVFGFVLVWVYAALRPTYGSGTATALRAAAVLYVPTTGIILGFGILGMLTTSLVVKMAISGAIVVGVGAVVAGRVSEKITG